jgi:preprotein translocase subunit SecG
MFYVLVALQVMLAFALIVLVLLQGGEGADIGAVFGGGSSQTVFGGRGPASFLAKATITVGALFLVTAIALTVRESRRPTSVMMSANLPAPSLPAAPASPQRAGNAAR